MHQTSSINLDSESLSRYSVGTLTYTKGSLTMLFVWMLWGDFCFTLMETVMPTLLPLSLKDLGVGSSTIGIIVGTIPSLMTIVINPIVSTASDRHRGPRGRRIPFLLWPTPFIALFLILIGYSPDVGRWLHGAFLGRWFHLTAYAVILGMIYLSTILFQFFNLFVGAVYWYLWADVVPAAFLGRFLSLFRVVGSLAGFFWGWFIMKYADTHTREIYLGIGLVYLAAFMVMCWKVKEGQYDPPAPKRHGSGFFGSIKTYAHECYTIPFYLWFFGISACQLASQSSNLFATLFARDTLHLSLDTIGKVASGCSIVSIPLLLVLGYISDRIHPMRMMAAGIVSSFVVSVMSYFGIHGTASYLVYSLAGTVTWLLFVVGQISLFPLVFPKDKYGQFCSAQAIIFSIGSVLGNTGIGLLIQYLNNDYRYLFAWRGVFWGLGSVCLLVVYRQWVRHGGAKNFVPPTLENQPRRIAGVMESVVGEAI